MSVHIGHLALHLPAGYGARAEAISRGVADGIAHLQLSESRSLESLRLEPVLIAAGASDAQVIEAVLRQVAAALELHS